MRYLKYVGLLGLFVLLAGVAAPSAHAQVRFGVGIGVGPAYVPAPGYAVAPPDCPYGYYGYYPYACAPYGYYGPDYFVGGVFIGAGPWFPSASVEATTGLGIAITARVTTADSAEVL